MKTIALLLTSFSVLALSADSTLIATLENAGSAAPGSSYSKTILDTLIADGFTRDVGHIMAATHLSICRNQDSADKIKADYYAVIQGMVTKAQERYQRSNQRSPDYVSILRTLIEKNQQNDRNQYYGYRNNGYRQNTQSYATALLSYAAAILTCKQNGRQPQDVVDAWDTIFSAATADGMAHNSAAVVATALMVPDYGTTSTTITPPVPTSITTPSTNVEQLPTPAPLPQIETTTPTPPQTNSPALPN